MGLLQSSFINSPSGGTQNLVIGGNTFEYTFSSTITDPPGTGEIRLNNATQNLATSMFVHGTTSNGGDLQDTLVNFVNIGDIVILRGELAPEDFILFRIESVTDNTTYVTYTVSFVDDSGAPFVNLADISFTVNTNQFDRDADANTDVLVFNTGGVLTSLLGGKKTTDAGGALNALGAGSISILSAVDGVTNIGSGTSSIAIGQNVTGSGDNSVAIGSDALVANGTIATANDSIGLGHNCGSTGLRGICVGANSTNIPIDGVLIGANADITVGGQGSVAIGSSDTQGARATGIGCIAIGGDNGTNTAACADGANCIAIGSGANFNGVSGIRSIAIGFGTEARATDSIAIGRASRTTLNDSILIGTAVIDFGTAVFGQKVGIGGACQVEDGSVAIGHNTHTQSENSIAIGNSTNATNNARVGGSANGGIAIGGGGVASTSVAARVSNGVGAIAIGGSDGLLDGANVNTAGAGAIAIGGTDGTSEGPIVTADNAVAMGAGATASADTAWQLGTGANSTASTLKFLDSNTTTASQFSQLNPTLTELAGTTHTLTAANAHSYLFSTNVAINAITIPTNATTALAIGTVFTGVHENATNTFVAENADSGTTDATTANKLEDSTQNFNTTVRVGMRVFNTTDVTTALVTAIDSDTVLSIDADIMTTGEAYTINENIVDLPGLTNFTSWSLRKVTTSKWHLEGD